VSTSVRVLSHFPKRQTLAGKHTPDTSRIPPQDFLKHRNEHAHGVVAQHCAPSYLGYYIASETAMVNHRD